jgi:hypothetical protein
MFIHIPKQKQIRKIDVLDWICSFDEMWSMMDLMTENDKISAHQKSGSQQATGSRPSANGVIFTNGEIEMIWISIARDVWQSFR